MRYDNIELTDPLADPNAINPETDVIQEEVFDKIKEAFKCLTRKQEEALTLTEINDMTYLEAAEEMGLGKDTVKTHCRQGRMRLISLLCEEADAINHLPLQEADAFRLYLKGRTFESIAKELGYVGEDGKPDTKDIKNVKTLIKRAKNRSYKLLRVDGYYALLENQ